jgi:hypothetical protein
MLILLLLSGDVFSEEFGVHQVKKGETISSILHKLELGPLYGKDGWTERILELNRVTLKKSKKLEPGDMLVIPRIRKEVAVVEDTITVKRSAIVKTGLLSRSSSKKYDFLIYTDMGAKNYKVAKLEDVSRNYSYGIGFEALGLEKYALFNRQFRLNYSLYINTQRSVSVGKSANTYAQFSPEVNFYSSALFDVSNFSFGTTLGVSEDSVVDSDGTTPFVRRDRKINLGLVLKNNSIENLLVTFGSYYSVYSKNLSGLGNIKTLTSYMSSDLNLINDFKIGVFGELEAIDRQDSIFGLRLTKLFK